MIPSEVVIDLNRIPPDQVLNIMYLHHVTLVTMLIMCATPVVCITSIVFYLFRRSALYMVLLGSLSLFGPTMGAAVLHFTVMDMYKQPLLDLWNIYQLAVGSIILTVGVIIRTITIHLNNRRRK